MFDNQGSFEAVVVSILTSMQRTHHETGRAIGVPLPHLAAKFRGQEDKYAAAILELWRGGAIVLMACYEHVKVNGRWSGPADVSLVYSDSYIGFGFADKSVAFDVNGQRVPLASEWGRQRLRGLRIYFTTDI